MNDLFLDVRQQMDVTVNLSRHRRDRLTAAVTDRVDYYAEY